MVTISGSNKSKVRTRSSAQLKYAVTYIVITVVVLVFLNLYCAHANQQLFRQSKYASLSEKASLTASEIGATGNVNLISASSVVMRTAGKLPRVVVSDEYGNIIYDKAGTGKYYPTVPTELKEALDGETAFTWDYSRGIITSAVAVPIRVGNSIVGTVYMLEIDRSEGALLRSLHINILTITLVLGIFLIVFSVVYVRRYSYRVDKIMASMHIIQDGNYSHKINMRGNDELRFLADEFDYLTDRLQISEDKRRQFVSDASHELKTPLASIKLLSDSILQYDMDMETVREFVGDIGNEADRLNRMTLKLLALTKDDGDSAIEDAEIIYIGPTVERVLKMLGSIAIDNNVRISTDLQQDVPVLIQEDDLYQIIYNLVENGIKYNVPGGKLSIQLGRQDDMAILRVTDTGSGIPPEAQAHVFERFYRVDKDRSRQSGGSGLGLAIVRNMVLRNNGEIALESMVGQGTTFTVAFPCFDISVTEPNLESENCED